MNIGDDDPRVYQALALPNEAIANGGNEVLRVGVIGDDLYVSARRAFKNPAQWGEVLADVTHRIAALYAAETPGLSKKDAAVMIAEAFVAEMGAKPVPSLPRASAKPKLKKKTEPKAKTKPKSAGPAAKKPAAARKKR